MSKGIDYSFGQANIDRETGIHYGVIPHRAVLQAWSDESEAVYPEIEISCHDCGAPVSEEDVECPDCGEGLGEFEYPEDAEPTEFIYEKYGYAASQSADDPDIFILKSPYYTLCKFCSPCAPGAGYLLDAEDDGIRAYCFDHSWFEDGKAPYRVFKVEDDTEVFPDV